MKQTIWLSYDLGVRGDYEGLYSWLDDQGAKECGDSVAYLTFSHDGSLIESLEEALRSAVSMNKRTRIYAVYQVDGKTKGRFLFGGRKRAPWEGYGAHEEQGEDEADVQAS